MDNLIAQLRHKKGEINPWSTMKKSPCKAAPGEASAQPERQPLVPQGSKLERGGIEGGNTNTKWPLRRVALFDTLVFLLNEYFIELNTANLYFLNKFLN